MNIGSGINGNESGKIIMARGIFLMPLIFLLDMPQRFRYIWVKQYRKGVFKIEKQFLTEKDVAKMLNRSPETIRSWRKSGTGPEYHIDPKGRVHYERNKVMEWFENK